MDNRKVISKIIGLREESICLARKNDFHLCEVPRFIRHQGFISYLQYN